MSRFTSRRIRHHRHNGLRCVVSRHHGGFPVPGPLWVPSILVGIGCLFLGGATCWAQAGPDSEVLPDWPQWMGPERNNHWDVDGLIDRFPAGGPRVVWRTPIAGGYAGPAVAGDRVFVTDYVTGDDVKVENFQRETFSGQERVLCLDRGTGDVRWVHEYPVRYTVSYPAGPRCTPVVEGDRLYTLGTEGDLICFDTESGDVIWQKNLPETYSASAPLWGYSAHLLIDGDRLLTLAGGEGAHVVALNKVDGSEIWKSLDATETGYSPPTIIEAGGARQLILARPGAVTSVDPETGEPYWSVPYEATNGSIIMSPVVVGDYLYIAGYSRKSLLLKLDPERPAVTEVWRDRARAAVSPVNVQPLVVDDVIYGLDQTGQMIALRIPDGERLWESTEPTSGRQNTGTAFIVQQRDRHWLFNERGELIIARLSAAGYEEVDRASVIAPSNLAFGRDVVWSMPAFAGRQIFVRNDNEIIAIDVAAN